MARVLCTRPNASDEISGVQFEQHEDGMLSVDISDDQAAAFTEIPGYTLFGTPAKPAKPAVAVKAPDPVVEQKPVEIEQPATQAVVAPPAGDPAPPTAAELEAAAELAAAVEEAKGLGIEVKGNWKIARLKAEIERAKAAKAEGKSE